VYDGTSVAFVGRDLELEEEGGTVALNVEFAQLTEKVRLAVIKGVMKQTIATSVLPILRVVMRALDKCESSKDFDDVFRYLQWASSITAIVRQDLTLSDRITFSNSGWHKTISGDANTPWYMALKIS
jgi:hypothetical protein